MLAVMHLIACSGERPFVVPPDLNPLVGEKILPLQRGLGALRLGVLVLGSFLFVHRSPFSGHSRIVSKAQADEMRMNSRGVRLLRTFCELEANFLELRKGEVRRIHLPRTRVNRGSCKLALTELGSNPPTIACRIFHPAATVSIAFPLLRLIDGETTGFQSPPV